MLQETGWVNQDDFTYEFTLQGRKTGTMKVNSASLQVTADCLIDESRFKIKRTGFWKTAIDISDEAGNSIVKVSPEKWYSSSYRVDYGNKKLKLIIRNNPLSEYVLIDNEKEILAYGLSTENKKPGVKISGTSSADTILHYLLWYLFVPVANENFGSDYSFLLTSV